MPDFDSAIFRTRDDNRQGWMEDCKGDIGGVAIEALNARFRMVIPYFDKTTRTQFSRCIQSSHLNRSEYSYRSSPVVIM